MGKISRRLLFAALLILLGAGLYAYRELQPQANVGAGYVAHQVCSCVFVAERSYDSCLPDLLPSMSEIRSEIVEIGGRRGARAWVPLLVERFALHTPGRGCALD